MRLRPSAVLHTLLIVAVVIVVARTVDWERLGGQTHAGFLFGILIAQPLVLASAAIQSWRYAMLVSDPPPPFSAAVAASLLASGLNNILPVRSGELIKASYLHARHGVPFGVGVAAVTVERLLDVLMLGVMVLAATTLLTLDRRWAWILVALSAGILCAAAVMLPRLGHTEKRLAGWLARRQWPVIAGLVLPMLRHIDTHMSTRRLAGAASLTILGWIAVSASYAAFLELAGTAQLTVATCAMLVVTTAVGIAIPILPGGLITFEGAAVLTLTESGYDFNTAVALAIGLRLCCVVTTLPISMILLARYGTGLGPLMRMVRDLATAGPGTGEDGPDGQKQP